MRTEPTPCCQIVDPGMDEDDAHIVAAQFRALADPTRVRMLNLLMRNDELCVCEMQANFDLSQPTVSHHLSLLRRAGLVDSQVRGRWAFYSARTEAIRELARILEVPE